MAIESGNGVPRSNKTWPKRESNNRTSPAFNLPPITFSLDIEERCIEQRDEHSLCPQALSLANDLIAEMSEENWNDLYRNFYAHKEMK